VGVDGKIRHIFPNDYSISNMIKGNKKYEIPGEEIGSGFRFYIKPPYGKERIYAFASISRIELEQLRKLDTLDDVLNFLKGESSKSLSRAVGVEPVGFAHDWCIFTSVEKK